MKVDKMFQQEKGYKKRTQIDENNPERYMELVRHLTRKTLDEETFKMSNDTIKTDMNFLVTRAKELEVVVSKEQESDGSITIHYNFKNPLLLGA